MSTFPFYPYLAVARYTGSGQLDTTFGNDGIQLVLGAEGRALAIHPSGKIFVAGATAGPIKVFQLVCLDGHGELVSSFGNGGKVVTSFPLFQEAVANSLAIDSEGRILVAGTVSGQFGLVRFLESGTLDSDFGEGGRVVTDIRFGGILRMVEEARAVATSPDGGIFVAGFAASTISPIGRRFALVRYTQDGELDAAFGHDGIVLPDLFRGSDETANAMAIDGDGRLVVTGHVVANNTSKFAVARFNPDGTLDSNFFVSGFRWIDFPSLSESARAVAIDHNDQIVLAGQGFMRQNLTAGYFDRRIALTRLRENGQLDNTFHSDGDTFGFELTDFVSPDEVGANAVAVDDNNRILIAGDGNQPAFALARYTSNGFLDNNFGSNGKVATQFNPPPSFISPPPHRPFDFGGATALAVDRQGRVLAAGTMGFNKRTLLT